MANNGSNQQQGSGSNGEGGSSENGRQNAVQTNEHPTIPDEVGQPDCPVCLTRVQNRAYTNRCLHEFCYSCIQEWSRTHNRCPVCREIYSMILHNIRSNNDYDSEAVNEPIDPHNGMLFLLGDVAILNTPHNTPIYLVNPVQTPYGIRHDIQFLGPNQVFFLRNLSPNVILVSADQFEHVMQAINARPIYSHHGRHPSFLRHHRHRRQRNNSSKSNQ